MVRWVVLYAVLSLVLVLLWRVLGTLRMDLNVYVGIQWRGRRTLIGYCVRRCPGRCAYLDFSACPTSRYPPTENPLRSFRPSPSSFPNTESRVSILVSPGPWSLFPVP